MTRAPSSSPITTSACAACACCCAHGVDVPLVVTHDDDPAETHLVRARRRRRRRATALPWIAPDDPNAPGRRRAHRARSRPISSSASTTATCCRPPLLALARARRAQHARLAAAELPRPRAGQLGGAARRDARPARRCTTWPPSPTPATSSRRQSVPILPDDTAREVFDKVTVAAETALDARAARAVAGTAPRMPQRSRARLLFRRPQAGRRPHRLVASSAQRDPQPRARRRAALSRRASRPSAACRRASCARACSTPTRRRAPALAVVTIARSAVRRRRCARRALRRRRHAAHRRARDRRQPIALRCARALRRRRVAARLTHSARSTMRAPRLRTHRMKRVLILGVNGFIGHHLSQAHPRRRPTGRSTAWTCRPSASRDLLDEPRFHFFEGDITINRSGSSTTSRNATWCCRWSRSPRRRPTCSEPLRVFELDFEANLPIVRACVQLQQAPGLPVDLRGLRHVRATREFDPEASRAGATARSTSRAGSTPARSS